MPSVLTGNGGETTKRMLGRAILSMETHNRLVAEAKLWSERSADAQLERLNKEKTAALASEVGLITSKNTNVESDISTQVSKTSTTILADEFVEKVEAERNYWAREKVKNIQASDEKVELEKNEIITNISTLSEDMSSTRNVTFHSKRHRNEYLENESNSTISENDSIKKDTNSKRHHRHSKNHHSRRSNSHEKHKHKYRSSRHDDDDRKHKYKKRKI